MVFLRAERLAVALLLAVLSLGDSASATPVTASQAKTAVQRWLRDDSALGCPLQSAVDEVRTCTPTNGASFHVVKLAKGGFVVTSADTRRAPVVAFSSGADLVEDDANPLWVLLKNDLAIRTQGESSGGTVQLMSAAPSEVESANEVKWAKLLGGGMQLMSAVGISTISDVRVAPLVQSKWGQSTFGNGNCFNYYTPNNYVCGCVATVGAQIMRYFCYPTAAMSRYTNSRCAVEGVARTLTTRGGTYNWEQMPLVLSSSMTEGQRQAIGKLTSDVGICCNMDYGGDGSAASGYLLAQAFTNFFGYANAMVAQWNTDKSRSANVRNALLSNFDAGLPVALSLSGAGGHEIVGDGYGYSDGTLYIHFNMGWEGFDDAWYAPPAMGTTQFNFSVLDGVVYNIFTNQTPNAVICSGRVLDATGVPVENSTVTAKRSGTSAVVQRVTSNTKGIYALILPAGSYTITATSGDKSASISVTLSANVSTRVEPSGTYHPSPEPQVNNVCQKDIELTDVSSVAEPQFLPPSCLFYPSTNVTISCATDGAVIRYTLDGNDPTESSALYTGAITIDDDVIVKARAWRTGMNPSVIATASYTYDTTQGAPKGDYFADPIVISGAVGSRTITDNAAYTEEDGEPRHTLQDGIYYSQYKTVWYNWTAPGSGTITFKTHFENDWYYLPSYIAVYMGDELSSITRIAFAVNNEDTDSSVTFEARQGVTYRIVGMSGIQDDTGVFSLSWFGDLVPSATFTGKLSYTLGYDYSGAVGAFVRRIDYRWEGEGDVNLDIPATTTIDGVEYPVLGVRRFAFRVKGDANLNVTFPEGMTTIEGGAFAQCGPLKSIRIPASVVSIGMSAFAACRNLERIAVDADNEYFSVIDGVLYDKSQTTLVCCPGGKTGVLTIPAGVTGIVDYALAYNSLSSIGVAAGNPSYRSVGGVLYDYEGVALLVGPGARAEVVIPDGVTNIVADAFAGSKLERVTIPSSMRRIGANAFDGSSLTAVACGADWERIEFQSRDYSDVWELGALGNAFDGTPWYYRTMLENDDFADAVELEDDSSADGWTIGATSELFEAAFGIRAASVWYRWTPATSGPRDIAINAWDSEEIPCVAVFTNATNGGLSLVAADTSGNMTVFADGGIEYYVCVSTSEAEATPFTLEIWPWCYLDIATGGDAPWIVSSDDYMTMRSGDVGDGQSSWIETTVDAPGQLEFQWNASSEGVSLDFLSLSVDGVPWGTIGGTDCTRSTRTVFFTNGTHTVRWTYRKNGCGVAGDDCGWLDLSSLGVKDIPESIEVMLVLNGDEGVAEEMSVVPGTKYRELPVPTREDGWTFAGWCLDAELTDVCVGDDPIYYGMKCCGFFEEGKEGCMLYARWEQCTGDDSAVNLTIVDGELTAVNLNGATELVVPEGVTRIGDGVLWSDFGEGMLERLTLPSTLESIGEGAFRGQTRLRSVVIPASVTDIEWRAFSGCISLATVVFAGDEFDIAIDNAAFAGTPYMMNRPFELIVKDGAVTGFRGMCPARLVLPDGVERVSEDAFEYTSYMARVQMSPDDEDGVVYSSINDLQEVIIPEGVASIGAGAFYGCVGLERVTIPNSVRRIGAGAFEDSGLSTVEYGGDWAQVGFQSMENEDEWEPGTLRNAFDGTPWCYKMLLKNDDFANAVELEDVSSADGWTIGATSELFEAALGIKAASVWYRWTPPTAGLRIIDVYNWESEVGIHVAVFTNAPNGELALVDANPNGHVAFFAEADVAHYISVSTSEEEACRFNIDVWGWFSGSATGGDAPWTMQFDDDCMTMRSGAVGDGQASWIETTIDGPGQLSFQWRTSSEGVGCDFLELSVDGVSRGVIGGTNCTWSTRTVFFTNGTHTVRWTYRKNGSDALGEDCGWLDFSYPSMAFWFIPESIEATFDLNGGEGVATQMSVVPGTKYRELPVPTREDCTFIGWCLDPELTDVCVDDDPVFYWPDIFGTPDGAAIGTFYAKWRREMKLVIEDGVLTEVDANGATELVVPEGVTRIGDGVLWSDFGEGMLERLTLPSTLESIGEGAFRGQTRLRSVVIPASVTDIEWRAFSGCISLETVVFAGDESDIAIDNAAFAGTPYMMNRPFELIVKDGAVTGFRGMCPARLVLPDVVERVSENAFDYTSYMARVQMSPDDEEGMVYSSINDLKEVVIPEGVASIGDEAFYGCSGLERVTIPNSVTNIGWGAFAECGGLTKILVGAENQFYKSKNGLLLSKDGKILIRGTNGNVVIPEGVTCIDEWAFGGCASLTRVVVPSTIASVVDDQGDEETVGIGTCAFGGCVNLTNMIFMGNAPVVSPDSMWDPDRDIPDCVAYVKPTSVGWNVEIPGTWNGMWIVYRDFELRKVVTFDANGGSPAKQAFEQMTAMAWNVNGLKTPTKSGYLFGGWYAAKTGGERVDLTSEFNLFEDATFYAHWNKMTVLVPTVKGVSVSRSLQADEPDVADWYSFTAAAGTYYKFAFTAKGGAEPGATPVVRVFASTNEADECGYVLVSNVASAVQILAGKKGTHYVKVSHADPANPVDSSYTLTAYKYDVGLVKLTSAAVTVNEGSQYVDVKVSRTASDGVARVKYATVAGTAKPGENYYPQDGEIVWANGDKSVKTVRIKLIPSLYAAYNANKQFSVKFSAPGEDEIDPESEHIPLFSTDKSGAPIDECVVTIKEITKKAPGTIQVAGCATPKKPVLEVVAGERLEIPLERVLGTNGLVGVVASTVKGTANKSGETDFVPFSNVTNRWEDGVDGVCPATIVVQTKPTSNDYAVTKTFTVKLAAIRTNTKTQKVDGQYVRVDPVDWDVPTLAATVVTVNILNDKYAASLPNYSKTIPKAEGVTVKEAKTGSWFRDEDGELYSVNAIKFTGPGRVIWGPTNEPSQNVTYVPASGATLSLRTDAVYEHQLLPLVTPAAPTVDKAVVAAGANRIYFNRVADDEALGIGYKAYLVNKAEKGKSAATGKTIVLGNPETALEVLVDGEGRAYFETNLVEKLSYSWRVDSCYVDAEGVAKLIATNKTPWTLSVLAADAPATGARINVGCCGFDIYEDVANDPEAVSLQRGIYAEVRLAEAATATVTKVSGTYPTGMSLKQFKPVANDVSTWYWAICGTPTKGGTYNVLLQAKFTVGRTMVSATTAALKFEVSDIPAAVPLAPTVNKATVAPGNVNLRFAEDDGISYRVFFADPKNKAKLGRPETEVVKTEGGYEVDVGPGTNYTWQVFSFYAGGSQTNKTAQFTLTGAAEDAGVTQVKGWSSYPFEDEAFDYAGAAPGTIHLVQRLPVTPFELADETATAVKLVTGTFPTGLKIARDAYNAKTNPNGTGKWFLGGTPTKAGDFTALVQATFQKEVEQMKNGRLVTNKVSVAATTTEMKFSVAARDTVPGITYTLAGPGRFTYTGLDFLGRVVTRTNFMASGSKTLTLADIKDVMEYEYVQLPKATPLAPLVDKAVVKPGDEENVEYRFTKSPHPDVRYAVRTFPPSKGKYTWRVDSYFEGGTVTNSSATFSFTVAATNAYCSTEQLAETRVTGVDVLGNGIDFIGADFTANTKVVLRRLVKAELAVGEVGSTVTKVAGTIPNGLALKQVTLADKTKRWYVMGTPTKAGAFQLVLQEKKAYPTTGTKTTTVAGTTTVIDFVVDDASMAQGTFTGLAWAEGDNVEDGLRQLAHVTVTAPSSGALSASVKIGGKTYAFKDTGYSYMSVDEEGTNVTAVLTQVQTIGSGASKVVSTNTLTYTVTDNCESNAANWRMEGTLSLDFPYLGFSSGTNRTEGVAYKGKICRDNSKCNTGKANEAFVAEVAAFAGYYTVALANLNALPGEPKGNGYVTMTLDAKGKAKFAGYLPDGTAYSASSVAACLVGEGDEARLRVPLYACSTATTKPYVFGGWLELRFLEVTEVAGDRVEMATVPVVFRSSSDTDLLWANDYALSTRDGTGGYKLQMSPSGGWYDTVKNLQAWYLYYDFSVSMPDAADDLAELARTLPDGYGFIAEAMPAGQTVDLVGDKLSVAAQKLVKNAEKYNDWDRCTNAANVKVTFTRATGIVSGTFDLWYGGNNAKGKYEQVNTLYKGLKHYGVFVPYRADDQWIDGKPILDDTVWTTGFFLAPQKIKYEAQGKTQTRTWTGSYRFEIKATKAERDWSEVDP